MLGHHFTKRIVEWAACAWVLALLPAMCYAADVDSPPMPLRGATLRIQLGLKDTQATSWNGTMDVSHGAVVRLDVVQPENGKASKSSWEVATRVPLAGKAKAKAKPVPVRPVIRATIDAPEDARVTVGTPQGEFAFSLGGVESGRVSEFLGGQATVERLPPSTRLTGTPADEDWPSAAVGSDGTVWVAFSAYSGSPPLDAKEIHEKREFDVLKPTANGDQVRLMKFDGSAWSEPMDVSGPRVDAWRPAVAVDGEGSVWVFWSQQIGGNWDLFARSYAPASGRWSQVGRLTTEPGTDAFVVAATNPKTGNVQLAWQAWREGSFDILSGVLARGKAALAQPPSRLFSSPANEWCPVIAFNSRGESYVAFDTYERGNYDVKLVARANTASPAILEVAASPRYEARPSLTVDRQDRVWIAYELGDENWGKDAGLRWKGRSGSMLYTHRDIAVRCLDADALRQVSVAVPAEAVDAGYTERAGPARRISLPRLSCDTSGRLWLLYRRHATTQGQGERWLSFFTHATADGWSRAVELPDSANLLDHWPALAAHPSGTMLAIHSTDYRTGGTGTAKQNDVFCSVLAARGQPAYPPLGPIADEPTSGSVVHAREADDVRRLRSYRAARNGKTYQLLRGEFHRHTSLTAHQDMDGTVEEMWRYALDAADMDWIGNGDHENGNGIEYLWWLVQKQTDLFHHPPRFMPMFTYERSRAYPSGHRNPMFARRGIRPLPYHPGGPDATFGTPEQGAPDIKTLYAYLKHFDGICASHTSATGMGTDWRDHDPQVEPVVEIYQGLRQNYEYDAAPGAPTAQDAIGGFQPAGFVWNAWRKGYTLGVEVSSDHYSTHISYAVVYAENASREAILDAFKKRHCYGAMDNIVLDVRCGEHMMGDVFPLTGQPTLDITAIGTQPIARLSIIRGAGNRVPAYVYDSEPNQQEIRLRWTDMEPAWGQRTYYYVRVEQQKPKDGFGAMAWASPLWITPSR